MLDQIDSNGDGEMLEVDWMPSEAFDHSTEIILQSLNNTDVENIQEVLSFEFTKLAILQKNTRIVLKNVGLEYFVKEIKPASVVLCEGDEVNLEFYEETETHYIARPPSPYPPLPELLNVIEPNIEPNIVVEPSAPPADEVIPSAPPENIVGGIKREGRFNPWRNKDFKPSFS